jgi:hypothetical protein
MTPQDPSRWARRRQNWRQNWRQNQDDALARRVDAVLRDTRYDALRSPRARRLLVGLALVSLASTVLLFWFGHSLLATPALVVTTAAWLLLRVAVRSIADLPNEFLDERLIQVRDNAYFESYRILGAVAISVPMIALLAMIFTGSPPEGPVYTVSMDQVQAFLWAFLGLGLVLPPAVVAVREPVI